MTVYDRPVVAVHDRPVVAVHDKEWANSVVRVLDLRLKCWGDVSPLERHENFILQGQLSVLTPILVSVPPPCNRSSTQKIPVILPKVQAAGYS